MVLCLKRMRLCTASVSPSNPCPDSACASRYTADDLANNRNLSDQDHQLASFLADAENRGLLDVYLVTIKHKRHTSEILQEENMLHDLRLEYNNAVTRISSCLTVMGNVPQLDMMSMEMDLDGDDVIVTVSSAVWHTSRLCIM